MPCFSEALVDLAGTGRQAVVAWPAPYRSWTLLDMIRFQAMAVAKAMAGLERALGLLSHALTPAGGYLHVSVAEAAQDAKRALVETEAACVNLPVSSSLRAQLTRAIAATDDSYKTPTMAITVTTLVQELQHNLAHELGVQVFLCIPQPRAALYDDAEAAFGLEVRERFPEAIRDLAAASRCFAMDEWTACVAHLMRALETPLQQFAARLSVTFPTPTDLENWKTIVDQMAKRLDLEVVAWEQRPKGHARNDELAWLGEVAVQFRHFKNAWRNQVAHGREWYDEREATRVYDAVKAFMQLMVHR